MKKIKLRILGGVAVLFFTLAAHAARPLKNNHSLAGRSGDEIREVENAQSQYRQAIQEINQLNPMSQDYRPDAVPTQPAGTGVPIGGVNGPAEQLRALLSNPAVRGYLKFFQSPAFSEGAQAIAQSANRKTLIWVEIIWFLLMFLSRSRSLSQVSTSSWGRVVWINLSHMVILWAGSLIAIPWVLFGEPYRKVIWGFFGVLFGPGN